MKAQLLVPAAGAGTRLGADFPKALIDLGGKPMLARTLEHAIIPEFHAPTLITAPPEMLGLFRDTLRPWLSKTAYRLVAGGAERQISVANGLALLDEDTEIVVIHDAARPFVAAESIRASVRAAAEYGAATVAIPVSDTILEGDDTGFLERTPDRRRLWACQTPQTFRTGIIREAHHRAVEEGLVMTDDASLARRYGAPVRLVMGTPLNFKITTAADLQLARLIVREGLA